MPQSMLRIVKAFRRPPTGRMDDRNGGLPRLSDVVAHALRCPASPRRTLKVENLGKPSLWVIITAPWYKASLSSSQMSEVKNLRDNGSKLHGAKKHGDSLADLHKAMDILGLKH